MRFRSLSTTALLPAFLFLGCQSNEADSHEADTFQEGDVLGQLGEPSEAPMELAAPVEPAPAAESEVVQASFTPQDGENPEEFLQEEVDRLSLLQQQQAYLSAQYVEAGERLLERADLPGALEQFSQALQVMPSNEAARAGLRRVQALMGDDYAQAHRFVEDETQRMEVRRMQAMLEAEEHVLAAENALRLGEYDSAIARYRQALVVLQYFPTIATDALDQRVLENKLETAIRLQEDAVVTERRRAQAEAEEARAREEGERRMYRERQLTTLYADAYAAFQRQQYSLCITLTEQVLNLDPGNEDALKMLQIARDARHNKRNEENLRNLHEQWLRTFDDLETLAIPQTESLIYDDLDRWREVSQRGPRGAFNREGAAETGERELIRETLSRTRVRARFGEDGEGAPLEEVANYLQLTTGINFVISPKVKDELDEDDTAVELDLPDRSVLKILDIIADTTEDLGWKIADGVVQFVTTEELSGGQVLRMYEVRDLIRPIRDFVGREINVLPSGGLEYPEEDIEEREALVVTGDTLDTLIRDNVDPDSWQVDIKNSLQITEAGTLVVNQTPEVHAQIEKLLDDLREATGIMVDIQTRFLTVEDNFLEDIGVDFRGLGAPGEGTNEFLDDFGDSTAQAELGNEIGNGTDLGAFYNDGDNGDVRARVEQLWDQQLGDDDVLTGSGGLSFQWTYLDDLQVEMILRAVSKSERVELVTAPRVLVFNTARANITVLNQVAYVQDFDVEIAQNASIADPVVRVVEDGVILDVRPVVSADRRFITLELRPTVAELQRPIAEVTTTLGNQNSVTIQLPELDISRVRTSVPMPDGATVLLGGLKIREERNLRSGIPILNKIPVVSFFFDRKGNYITNRKLLILLTAEIVLPSEHEPSPAQGAPAPIQASF